MKYYFYFLMCIVISNIFIQNSFGNNIDKNTLSKKPQIWDVHVVCPEENNDCMMKRVEVLQKSKNVVEKIIKSKKLKDKKLNIMVTWFGDIKNESKNKYQNKDIKITSDIFDGKESIIAFFLLPDNQTKIIDIWERSKNDYDYSNMIPVLDDDLVIIILPFM